MHCIKNCVVKCKSLTMCHTHTTLLEMSGEVFDFMVDIHLPFGWSNIMFWREIFEQCNSSYQPEWTFIFYLHLVTMVTTYCCRQSAMLQHIYTQIHEFLLISLFPDCDSVLSLSWK